MERDTDADWRKIGETEPFWGVLTEDRFRRDRMDQAAKHAFYATGAEDIGFVLSRIQLMVPHFHPRQALDFGCGIGRLTLAMARRADAVTGVDISSEMLDEARRAAGEFFGYSRFWSFDGEAAHAGLDQDPNPVGTVRMYDYDLNRVFAAMLAQKVELFGIAPTDHGGHHGAWFFGRRSGTP